MRYDWCSFCGSKKTTFVQRGSSIVNSLINNLLVKLHYQGHNFLEPGTKLNKRLNNDTTPKEWSIPVDRDNVIDYRHNLCYAINNDGKTRNAVCDKNNMLDKLKAVPNPTPAEQRHSLIAETIIGMKKRLGWVLKKVHWTDELTEELHKPVQNCFCKRRIWVSGIADTWAADLVAMTEFAKDNDRYKYLLAVRDVFSEYSRMIPLKIRLEKRWP